jgi:hypothetical protein
MDQFLQTHAENLIQDPAKRGMAHQAPRVVSSCPVFNESGAINSYAVVELRFLTSPFAFGFRNRNPQEE